MASALEILESVSQWTAHHLDRPSVFAEHAKEQGYDPKRVAEGPRRAPFVLKRGYDEAVKGRRVLVVVTWSTPACPCARRPARPRGCR